MKAAASAGRSSSSVSVIAAIWLVDGAHGVPQAQDFTADPALFDRELRDVEAGRSEDLHRPGRYAGVDRQAVQLYGAWASSWSSSVMPDLPHSDSPKRSSKSSTMRIASLFVAELR